MKYPFTKAFYILTFSIFLVFLYCFFITRNYVKEYPLEVTAVDVVSYGGSGSGKHVRPGYNDGVYVTDSGVKISRTLSSVAFVDFKPGNRYVVQVTNREVKFDPYFETKRDWMFKSFFIMLIFAIITLFFTIAEG